MPRRLTARAWRLRLAIDLQDTHRGSAAVITVRKKRGTSTSFVRLDRRGDATRTVPFSSRNVRAVEVTLVNTSVRYRACWGYNTPYACGGGIPRDDDLLQSVDPKAVR
ncbi:hypothetical protein [Nocardioides sp. TF02-7]|uniref:hypothetical protein n=1 Tax=Nocardioides sp. TF02-7 TaxID=2917724 RepID=UPI001F056F93|nr:hypothetical protein [Nocardioides sp. TF02-7]UMG91923.1 hypothetical protein MF408_18150 [Nocardioides sp. TF02-7]